MNDTEVIMSHELPANTLIAREKALEAAAISMALVTRIPAPLKSLADQVVRSAVSVPDTATVSVPATVTATSRSRSRPTLSAPRRPSAESPLERRAEFAVGGCERVG